LRVGKFMNKEKIEEYNKLRDSVDKLNSRIAELNTRQKVCREQAKKKMHELGCKDLDSLKAKVKEERELLDSETERMAAWLEEIAPLLDELEKS